MVVMLGSVALPLTNGFIGEFLMLFGLAHYSMAVTVVGGMGIIFGAVYMFWFYQKTMYGEPNRRTIGFTDLTTGEMIVAIPLVVLVLVMGVYPGPILDILRPALESILSTI
jgi:NADH-quinone oxidoreductase subunit M